MALNAGFVAIQAQAGDASTVALPSEPWRSSLDEQIAGLKVHAHGTTGSPILLIAGPPLGAVVFEHVQRRMAPRKSIAVELVGIPSSEATLAGLSAKMDQVVQATQASAVVAHGLAVPVAMRTKGVRVYVSNGPLRAPDAGLRGLASAGQSTLAQLIMQPALARRWMASSAGLRRAVVNPYVMDRDTVVRLSAAVLESPETRATASAWIRACSADVDQDWAVDMSEVFGIWGDSDPLYPLAQLRSALAGPGANLPSVIPGGRNMHLVERPWELADRVMERELALAAT